MGKVIVSGLGVLSVLGNTLAEHIECMKAGIHKFDKPENYNAAYNSCRVQIDNPGSYIKNKKAMRFYGKDTIMALTAASLAIEDSALPAGYFGGHPYESGLILGTSYIPTGLDAGKLLGEYITEDGKFDYCEFGNTGIRILPPLWMLSKLPNTPAGQISIEKQIRGLTYSIANGMNSGLVSIGEAFLAILQDRESTMICGGTDMEIRPDYLAECKKKKILSQRKQPAVFSLAGDGYVDAEGAAIIILQSEEEHLESNGKAYAEVTGYHNAYIPQIDQMAAQEISEYMISCMKAAMKMADVDTDRIKFIQVSAGGDYRLDYAEALAIGKLFDQRTEISSAQAYVGNTRAASGAISAALACLQLREAFLAERINEGDLLAGQDRFNPGELSQAQEVYCLVNSFSYLGEVCTIVLKNYQG